MIKKLTISIPILITIIVSVVVTTVMINNKDEDPNFSLEKNQLINDEERAMDKVYIDINNETFEMDLEDNSTVSALVKMLPLNLSMSDLNSNEKYAYFDKPLPTNTYSPKHIEAGDVMLFSDNCLVIFYESFDTSYNYSKIGHINNMPNLGDGNISISIRVK